MTMACEMRCPWYCRNERAQRVYLVLSRVACLAAIWRPRARAAAGSGRAGCGLSPPAEDLGDERDDLLAARESAERPSSGLTAVARNPGRCPRRRGRR
jgi:hypothetical protein